MNTENEKVVRGLIYKAWAEWRKSPDALKFAQITGYEDAAAFPQLFEAGYRAALQSQSNTDGCAPWIDLGVMVNRFLGWRLPEDFYPDAGVAFNPTDLQKSGVHPWPTGTNLLNATQALAMLDYVLEGQPVDVMQDMKAKAQEYERLIAEGHIPPQQEQSGEAVALPERDVSKPAKQQGVFRKFEVSRVDGSDHPGGKHHGCEYFVLDVTHDQHAKAALAAYAEACKETHHELSCDMVERYGLYSPATPTATASQASREAQMVTLRVDESGNPTVWCDPEIADLVDALNTDKLSTVASCSGHEHRPGRISLKDGRELLVMDSEQVAVVERLFGTDINGQSADDFANAEAQEAVAYGLPNTAITGKKQALMQVRLDIPSNDQYGGALWVPLFLAPPTSTAIAAMVIKQAAECITSTFNEIKFKDNDTQLCVKAALGDALLKLKALAPANAEAELEALMMKVAKLSHKCGVQEGIDVENWGRHEIRPTDLRAIVRRVLDEAKGEVK